MAEEETEGHCVLQRESGQINSLVCVREAGMHTVPPAAAIANFINSSSDTSPATNAAAPPPWPASVRIDDAGGAPAAAPPPTATSRPLPSCAFSICSNLRESSSFFLARSSILDTTCSGSPVPEAPTTGAPTDPEEEDAPSFHFRQFLTRSIKWDLASGAHTPMKMGNDAASISMRKNGRNMPTPPFFFALSLSLLRAPPPAPPAPAPIPTPRTSLASPEPIML